MVPVQGDTDIGGWPGVAIVGVTTSSDEGGMRAGLASYALRLAGRGDVSVAAGAEGSLGGYRGPHGLSDLGRYWPEPVEPEPSPPDAARDLLARNAEANATIVAIGPWTNLALLEAARPGLLASTHVVVMGGFVRPPDLASGRGRPTNASR